MLTKIRLQGWVGINYWGERGGPGSLQGEVLYLRALVMFLNFSCLFSPDTLSSFLSSKKVAWVLSIFLPSWYLVEPWTQINTAMCAWLLGVQASQHPWQSVLTHVMVICIIMNFPIIPLLSDQSCIFIFRWDFSQNPCSPSPFFSIASTTLQTCSRANQSLFLYHYQPIHKSVLPTQWLVWQGLQLSIDCKWCRFF